MSTRLRQTIRSRARPAARGRAQRTSRGRRWRPLASVARVNAFPHRSRCSGVCVRSSRRVPSVILRTDYYTTAASAAVAGEVTAAVTVGRPRWEGAHVNHEQRDRSHAMHFARSPLPLTGYLSRSSRTIILYKIRFARRPALDFWLCHFFSRIENFYSPLLAPTHRFCF